MLTITVLSSGISTQILATSTGGKLARGVVSVSGSAVLPNMKESSMTWLSGSSGICPFLIKSWCGLIRHWIMVNIRILRNTGMNP